MRTPYRPGWLIIALLSVLAWAALRWVFDDPVAGDLFGGKRI